MIRREIFPVVKSCIQFPGHPLPECIQFEGEKIGTGFLLAVRRHQSLESGFDTPSRSTPIIDKTCGRIDIKPLKITHSSIDHVASPLILQTKIVTKNAAAFLVIAFLLLFQAIPEAYEFHSEGFLFNRSKVSVEIMLPTEPTVFDGSERFLLLVRIKRAEEPHDVVQMQGVDGAVEINFPKLEDLISVTYLMFS